MPKQNIPFYFLLLTILTISCVVKKTKLSPSEIQWVNVYKTGDTLIFKSGKGEYDTSFIIKTEVYYPEYMPIEVHEKYLPQHGRIIYKNKNLKNRPNGTELLLIIKQNSEETHLFIDYLYAKVIITDISAGEAEKYRNGIVYEFDTYHPKASPREPKKIFWHKEHGIIKYITHGNVVWERINISQ